MQKMFMVEVDDKELKRGFFVWDGLALQIADRILIGLNYCGYCESYLRENQVREKIAYNLKSLKEEVVKHNIGFDYWCPEICLNFSIYEIKMNEFVRA